MTSRASRPPPGRSARVSRTRSAWRSRSARSPRRSTGPATTIIDHHTYVFLGDGCMMEGISHEAGSFAGTQKLGKLIVVYDDNGISIDGKVVRLVRRQHREALRGLWLACAAAMSTARTAMPIAAALAAARAETGRPSLICAKTVIGWGAPNKQGTAAMHGEADGQRGNRRHARSTWVGLPRRSRYPPTFARPGTGARRARARSRNGVRDSRRTRRNSRRWQPNWSGAWPAICPAASMTF